MGKLYPRSVSPELVEIGDTVSVCVSNANGVTITYTGKVGSVHRRGGSRTFKTSDGGVLFIHTPGGVRPRVMLLDREPVAGETLFSFTPELIREVECNMVMV